MQFRDLKKQYSYLKNEIDTAVSDVISESSFIMGKQVGELEEKLASFVGRKYCVSCANGTDALLLTLMVMGVKEGDAVFVPDFTYIASASTIVLAGATPIFVDIDLETFNMSSVALEKAINKVKNDGKLNSKAIIPVDLFGLPADYTKIIPIAQKNGLKVIEDAAQGFGGMIGKKKACSFGDISCTSFFPAKPLGCYGDGGAVFTDDDKINEILRSLRANGKSSVDKYDNIMIGMNSRLDTLQAAILLPKLKAFAEHEFDDVNNVAKMYTEKLKEKYVIPMIPNNFKSSYAQYTLLLKDSEERQRIQIKLKERNIPSMIYYPRGMHEQKCFSYLKCDSNDYRNSIEATKRVLSIPIHPYMTNEDIDKVCEVLLEN